jgi:hypothetical protein
MTIADQEYCISCHEPSPDVLCEQCFAFAVVMRRDHEILKDSRMDDDYGFRGTPL